MSVFDSAAFEGHEALHAFSDQAAGLKCFIAIHSTARGPAAGGCRMWPYATEQDAIDDALRLSRAMSFKNAVADLDLGGGKSVIIGDARTQKTPEMFRAFGRAVEAVGGRYWGAEDVGLSPADLAEARRSTRFIAGLEGHPAASGDPSPVTADGIARGIELCVRRVLGRDLAGVRVSIQGVGHVGGYLADKLAAAGARLTVADVHAEAAAAVARRTGAAVVPPDAIFDVEADVFAPCALGGAVNQRTLPRLKARIVAGGANNQLADPEVGRALYERGMTYAPDFVINGGGIINIAGEIRALERGGAFDAAWVEAKLVRLTATLDQVLEQSLRDRRPTHEIAIEIARSRIAEAGDRAAG
ncbi:MAG TPA: Glu/Leu/Phe/Val dehydrogenase dimerization domain-containing protein [Caulobacteraceae bacterium]|nr:Glu/Leu/Phe/Val dehydrogenase dimerization domain-containing protein [Caulobacteraceae bacterium]